jgi:Tfp pilus assembly PilM family ATPase
MRYHTSLARGARVSRLLFLGEEAHDKALVRVLGASLSIPCEVGDPLALVGQLGQREEAEPELAVAVGLGLFSTN